jgi:hypothetical protein
MKAQRLLNHPDRLAERQRLSEAGYYLTELEA